MAKDSKIVHRAKIHYRMRGRAVRYPCGVGKRWMSQTISSTSTIADVTCAMCIRLCKAFGYN